jgi:hypothetical protein
MNMRKLFAVALALAALALTGAGRVAADPAGGVQPACADIIGDLPTYNTADTPNTVQGGIHTAAPTCHGYKYAAVVSYVSGGQQRFAFFTDMGGNDLVVPNADESGFNGLIKFQIPDVVSDTNSVCVAYFSYKGSKLYDAVPDAAEFIAPPTPATNCGGDTTGWMAIAGGSPGGSFPYN